MLVGWLVEAGAAFTRGDPLLEVETDKTVAEFPALADGVIEETLAREGDRIAVGTPIARVEIAAGDRAAMLGEAAGAADTSSPADGPAAREAPAPATRRRRGRDGRTAAGDATGAPHRPAEGRRPRRRDRYRPAGPDREARRRGGRRPIRPARARGCKVRAGIALSRAGAGRRCAGAARPRLCRRPHRLGSDRGATGAGRPAGRSRSTCPRTGRPSERPATPAPSATPCPSSRTRRSAAPRSMWLPTRWAPCRATDLAARGLARSLTP